MPHTARSPLSTVEVEVDTHDNDDDDEANRRAHQYRLPSFL